MERLIIVVFLSFIMLFVGNGCGSDSASGSGSGCSDFSSGDLEANCVGSGSDLPDVSESSSDRATVGCAGRTTDNADSVVFTCSSTGESLTVWCNGGILEDDDNVSGFASTSNCEDGTVSCFNGAINTSCTDTTTE